MRKIKGYKTKRMITTVMFHIGCMASLQAQQIPNEMINLWKTDSTKITVREKVKFMNYKFTTKKLIVKLNIKSEHDISGSIGDANFQKATINKNKGNPKINGIEYIIHCGKLDKLFSSDPTKIKTIEIWVKPTTKKGMMTAEIRLIDEWDTFPMGEIILTNNQ